MQQQKTERIFLSFAVPGTAGQEILSMVSSHVPELVPYPLHNLHTTLHFIGDSTPEEADAVAKIAQRFAEQTGTIEFAPESLAWEDGRLKLFLKKNRPVALLNAEIRHELKKNSLGKPDEKSYRPHITLGRGEVPDSTLALPEAVKNISFTVSSFNLYTSIPGSEGLGEYKTLRSFELSGTNPDVQFSTIILPTRSQPDTLVAIFILKHLGNDIFPGVKDAKIVFSQTVPNNQTPETLEEQGTLLIDLGGWRFDHHGKNPQTTASRLVSEYIGELKNPGLEKLLAYAERDDFFGKGTVSTDPLDRAFGLSGLIASLNKKYQNEQGKVVSIVLPLIEAHYTEELRRAIEIPEEFAKQKIAGNISSLEVKQRDKKLKVIVLASDNASMAGYLRSRNGGGHDVVAQYLSSGHLNILTRPMKRIDLRSLAALLRVEEATRAHKDLSLNIRQLEQTGRINEIPEWYYDPATNSLQNGGLNPGDIPPTRIPRNELPDLLHGGLSGLALR